MQLNKLSNDDSDDVDSIAVDSDDVIRSEYNDDDNDDVIRLVTNGDEVDDVIRAEFVPDIGSMSEMPDEDDDEKS